MKFIVKTFEGLEAVLCFELEQKGFKNPKPLRRAASFIGNLEDLYRANYTISLGLRILQQISYNKVNNEKEFYEYIYQIPWHRYFSVDKSIRVDVVLLTERYKNSLFLAQKAKDAIADRFRKETNERPVVDTRKPNIVINIHITDLEVTLSLDSSGETLNRRGYREFQGLAPINEVLARGMLSLSGWKPDAPLLDPMCGSGTIAIEATYEANSIPSGYLRNQYAFMHWLDFDRELWKKVREQENDKMKEAKQKIIGADIDSRVLIAAKKSIQQLPYSKSTLFIENNFFENVIPFEKGFIVSNLPYDERIEIENIQDFYNKTGTQFKFNYKANNIWLLMSKEFGKFISLKPKKKINLLNGKIECTFNEYEVF
ncbi:MAG TPA: THUMP domain-containing protein [Bacteroidales bacterium]|nr:THUMP domain-containing protein [Bacteroidales bacterium]